MPSGPLHRAARGDGVAPDDAATRTIDDDTAFRLLDSGRRRAVVRHLASASRPVRVEALADAMATPEADCAPSSDPPAPDDRRRVAASLRHVDLPKLANAGVITHDERRNVVTPTPRLGALADRLAGSTDRRSTGQRGGRGASLHAHALAALCAAAVTTLALSERVVAALSASVSALVAAAVVGSAVFGGLALTGARTERPLHD